MSATTVERPRVAEMMELDPPKGEALSAARWQMFERVATELMTDALAERWNRAAEVHEQWAIKDAEANKPNDAKHCHEIAAACRERVELIRRYPETFTDTMEVLADIFAEGQVVRDGQPE